MTDTQALTGLKILEYLASHGGRFCKVTSARASGDSPGKRAFETGWQEKPYDSREITLHYSTGGNVGLLCGQHSNGLVLLDIDQNYFGFCDQFPDLGAGPTIVHAGSPDKGKILIKISGEIPRSKKWKHPGDSHPFFEFLSTGNQGVIAGIHNPSNAAYQLINPAAPIPSLSGEALSHICYLWTRLDGLDLPNGIETSTSAASPIMKPKREYPHSDGLRDRVLEYWTPLKVFEHFGRANDPQPEKDGEIRLKGNGGLFVRPESGDWAIPGDGKGSGGGTFEAWQYCKTGKCDVPQGAEFYNLLKEMAAEGHIEMPEPKIKQIEPPPNWEDDIAEPSPMIGERLPPKQVEAAIEQARTIPCPDPELPKALAHVLTMVKTPSMIKRRQAGDMVLAWLTERGEFIRSESDELYYLYKPDLKLFNLSTNYWRAWLYSLTGANPGGTDYTYIQADCQTVAMLKDRRPVIKMAAWDKNAMALRVSRFDGMVYCLDGATITEEGNGENVIFDDDPNWKPYDPDYSKPGTFAWLADAYWSYSDPTNQEKSLSEQEQYRLALRVWILSTFFTELHPTRPLLAMVGEKGSGKSMTIRRFLQAMHGRDTELPGVPDKADGFTAAASAAHILAIDNLDGFQGWMRDKLARLATGAVDHYRKLYTNNEQGTIHYRSWLAFTSRTPDTLRRDDLADRLVILPVAKIPDTYLKAERGFLDAVESCRNAWWGDLLTTLNRIVTSIRHRELKNTAILRMGDWESFGRLVARLEGKEPTWDAFIAQLKIAQSDLLLEDDLIVDAILTWLEKTPGSHGVEITSPDLYHDLSALMYPVNKPPKDWPGSSISFGRRMQGLREALKTIIDIEWRKDRTNVWKYTFWPKGRKGA